MPRAASGFDTPPNGSSPVVNGIASIFCPNLAVDGNNPPGNLANIKPGGDDTPDANQPFNQQPSNNTDDPGSNNNGPPPANQPPPPNSPSLPNFSNPTEGVGYPPRERPLTLPEYINYIAKTRGADPNDPEVAKDIAETYDQYREAHDPDNTDTEKETEQIFPHDPNNILGPGGAGAEAISDVETQLIRFDGFVRDRDRFGYTIQFENKASASAPAQQVIVTQTLDADLDLSTFELGSFGFGDTRVVVPAGRSSFSTRVDVTATLGIFVDIEAVLNLQTRVLTVTITSIDPLTGDLPLDPFAGVLQPNITPPEGDGFIEYSVKPLPGLANHTQIHAQARIVFDTEAPIDTPLIHNTIDNVAPTSAVVPFVSTTTARTIFKVGWTSSDEQGGSGVESVSLFYTDNGGEIQPFTIFNIQGGARFTGVVGHTYQFFTAATDAAGNVEVQHGSPNAIITVVALVLVPVAGTRAFTDSDGDVYTVKISGPGTLNAVLLDPDGNGKGALDFLMASGTTKASKISVTVKKAGGGDGLVAIGDAIVTGDLGSFLATQSDLVVNGLSVSGTLGTVSIRDLLRPDPILADPVISAGGSASNTTKITLHRMDDGASIELGSSIASLTAARIGDGLIQSPFVSKLTVSGDKKLGIAADMKADLQLTGQDAKGISLGTLKAGSVVGSNINAAGAIGSITVLEWSGGAINAKSLKLLSVTGDRNGIAGDFTSTVTLTNSAAAQTLGTVKLVGSLLNSRITSAGNVGSVTLGAMNGSQLLIGTAVGVEGLAQSVGDFVFKPAKPSLASISIKGLAGTPAGQPSFAASVIDAWGVGKAAFKLVDTAAGSALFGIAADKIASLTFQATGVNAGKPVTLKALDTAADLSNPKKNPANLTFPRGQFTLRLV